MKILITGITGFLGANISRALNDQGHQIIGIKRRNSILDRIIDLENVELVDLETTTPKRLLKEYGQINGIIHTATSYGRNGESIKEIITSNTIIPLDLYVEGLDSHIEFFFNADTMLQKYLNLYALSKNQFLQWGKYLSKSHNIKFINIKHEHFYGPFDREDKFSSYVIRSCIDNIDKLPLTKGEQERDFLFVDDVVSAYLCLLDNLPIINMGFTEVELGSGVSTTIQDFVKKIHSLTNSNTVLDFGALPYRDGEVMKAVADISYLNSLGWRPSYTLEQGILKTIHIESLERQK